MDILGSLRKEIDQIDTQMMTLLLQRCQVVNQIAQLKKSQAGPMMQSLRESQIMQRMLQLDSDQQLDPVDLIGLWRQLLSVFLARQGRVVFDVVGSQTLLMRDVLRQFLGFAAEFRQQPTLTDALSHDDQVVGVIVDANSQMTDCVWWQDTDFMGDYQVAMVFPKYGNEKYIFLLSKNGIQFDSSMSRVYSVDQQDVVMSHMVILADAGHQKLVVTSEELPQARLLGYSFWHDCFVNGRK